MSNSALNAKQPNGNIPDVEDHEQGYVMLTLADQLCGVAVLGVREVVANSKILRVPLAPPDIAGNINLRGRIVTAIDTRRRLGLDPARVDAERVALVTETGGNLYALLVDGVQEVLALRYDRIEPVPPNMPSAWRTFSSGVVQLPDRLMVVLNLNRLLAGAV